MSLISKNKEISVLFLITFLLRVVLVFTAGGIANDGCSYVELAKEIAAGNIQEISRSTLPPLFPLFIAGASYIFHDFEISARIISCIFGSLTVFPLFFLIKNIFDKKTALITVLFFIIHPYLFQASGEVLTEAIYYFFLTSTVSLCWIALQKKKSGLFLVVGLLILLAFLARFEGFFLIFLVLAWIWLFNLSKIRTEIRWKIASSFFCIITFIIVLLPYCLIISKGAGKFQICTRQQHYEKILFEPVTAKGTPLQKIGRVVKGNFIHSIPQIPFFFVKSYYSAFLLPLVFGLAGRKRLKGFKLGELFILSFILHRLFVLLIFAGMNARYLYAFIPIALCWAGVGFWEIDYRLQEKFKDKNLVIGKYSLSRYSIIILVVIMAICLPRGLRPIRQHRAVQKEAGYWLKANAGQKEFVIVSPSPQEAFYAGASWYVLKGKTYTEVIENARNKNADFIIIDRNIEKACPDFKDSVKADDLEVLTNKFEEDDRKILIYKLLELAR